MATKMKTIDALQPGVKDMEDRLAIIILVIVRDLNKFMSTYNEWFKFVWPHFV